MRHTIGALPAALLAMALPAPSRDALAQSIQSQPLPQVQAQAQPHPTQKGNRPQGTTAKQAQESSGGEGQLRQRVDQLEEQLTDMQVVIGTLESLAKSGAGAPASGAPPASFRPAGGGNDAGRVEVLEAQIRALTAQVEQLSSQVRALAGRRADLGGPERDVPLGGRGEAGYRPDARGGSAAVPGFGATTVTPGENDDIGQLLTDEERGQPRQPGFGTPGPSTAALNTGPEQLYKTAYTHLLQQNYSAAEASFDEFLKRYPNDALAGNAQYWLGEVYYVQGEYKQAAGAFLKGSRTYSKSAKAPDSLLKLAMSLDRLGQREAACQAYSELTSRYPNPPAHLKERMQNERQRAGC